MDHNPDYAKGLALTAIGGLALTIDIPLIRLAEGDKWSVLMVRSGVTFAVAIIGWLIWRALSDKAPPLIPGRTGAIVAALYGISSVTFMAAVYTTSTANVVFILAFNTMFAALLGWLFLGQRPQPVTLAAMALMVVGVLIIVGDSLGSGTLMGDMFALTSAFLIAAAITITRASGKHMGFAPLMAVILPFLLGAFMLRETGVQLEAPWWIILNGAIVMPLSFFLLATGPRYLTGPEVAMFYLLETVLAPIWVWMIFSEVPSTASLVGGTILIVTLIAHSAWQLYRMRRRRPLGAMRHPI